MNLNISKTEAQFAHISIKDSKLKAIVNVYQPETNDAYQYTYRNDAPVHEEFTCAVQSLGFHVEQLLGRAIPNLKVEGYYRRCAPKVLPEDEFGRQGFLAFWREWRRRRGK